MSSAPRQPRSKLYDGVVYGRIVEPMLSGVHGFVAERLPPGQRVLDACCGTGALSRRLAASGRQVVGVDLSPRNIAYARAASERTGLGPDVLRFEIADVSKLRPPDDGPYDVAALVLALHEMPADSRQGVLQRVASVAGRVMLVDYAVPMPWNPAGLRNRAMEMAAGLEHFSAFRDYNRRGGLHALVDAAGVDVESQRRIDAGTLDVMVVRRA